MPTLRAYRETDWEAFLALDLETGDATLRHETEEVARARALGGIGLGVDADNVVARKLYEEMGFETVRLRMVRTL